MKPQNDFNCAYNSICTVILSVLSASWPQKLRESVTNSIITKRLQKLHVRLKPLEMQRKTIGVTTISSDRTDTNSLFFVECTVMCNQPLYNPKIGYS